MPFTGQSLPRLEDRRLLTGGGRFVDDLPLADAAEVAVLRSPHAHARIIAIHTAAALALPGVLAVVTAADLGEANQPFPVLLPHPCLTAGVNAAPLASDVVRYVGEPVAVVAATDRYVAEDALDLIRVEYEALPAATALEATQAPGAPRVHAAAPENVAGDLRQGKGDLAAAFAAAHRVLRQRLRIARGSAQSMETRAVAAEYTGGRLTVWTSSQAPFRLKAVLPERLGLTPAAVRAVAPDVGGAFGPKGNLYGEELVVPWLALHLGRPVRWVEDRREHFLATTPDREQVIDVAVAVDPTGRLLGLEVDFRHDLGAYAPYGMLIALNIANHCMGPYVIPAVAIRGRGVYTHRTPTAAYRGAGRPQGVFLIERTLDLVARELGLDPAVVRERNLIPAVAMPYDTGVGGVNYDSGDYPASQAAALAHLDYAGWRAEQAGLRAAGRRVGLGLANYIEINSAGPFEGATVSVTAGGAIAVACGAGAQGQGHATTFAQICADALSVTPDLVHCGGGDTDALARSFGTYGSRSTILVGSAVLLASRELRAQALQLAAERLEVAQTDLEWQGTQVAVRGAPKRRLTLAELAAAAGAAGLTAPHYFMTDGMHVSNGTHAAAVEVVPETGEVRVLRYVVMHDCGRVVNPLTADGQVYGGFAQGIGGVLYERLVYDGAGQLLTASLMDYLLPTAVETPAPELHHMESPSPHNPLGAKGAGEGGNLPVYAVIAAAVEDAVGAPVRALPLTPEGIREMLLGGSD